MNNEELKAIEALQNEEEQKTVVFKHLVQTRGLLAAQELMFPMNSRYYPTGETEPI